MAEVKKGDVVVRTVPGEHTEGMIFYVRDPEGWGFGDEARGVLVYQITSTPQLAWSVGFPADELKVVGHIDGEFMERGYVTTQEEAGLIQPIIDDATQAGWPIINRFL